MLDYGQGSKSPLERGGELMARERRVSGATHSFRLTQKATTLIQDLPDGRSGKHVKSKSDHVSEAIAWWFTSPIYALEKKMVPDEYGIEWSQPTGRLIKGSHGQPVPYELLLRVEELEQEIDRLKSQKTASKWANLRGRIKKWVE
tara:strand:+ start:539 stop:973 length:435 start_codon:yes stop_codon:yes gene_type:complete